MSAMGSGLTKEEIAERNSAREKEHKQDWKEAIKEDEQRARNKQVWWPSSVAKTMVYPVPRKDWRKMIRKMNKKSVDTIHNQLVDAALLECHPPTRKKPKKLKDLKLTLGTYSKKKAFKDLKDQQQKGVDEET